MSQTKAQLVDAVDGSIVTADIADDAVNADKLASNSVVSASIVDGSIVNADINASAAIAGSKIADFVTGNTNNRILTASGTANSLIGEANATFNGDSLGLNSSSTTEINLQTSNNTRFKIQAGSNFAQFLTQNGNNLAFKTDAGTGSGTERMRIDTSGRLLVGTTTEGVANASKFTIADSGHCGMTIRSGTSNDGQIAFSDGTSGDDEFRGQIRYNHTSNFLTLVTNAAERMRIDSSGNVGIGVTDPNTTLHIRGSNNNGELEGLRIQNNNTGSGTKTSIGFTNTTQSDYEHGRILCTRDNAGRLDFQVGAQNHTVLCVDGFASGVVGVNTVQASKALDVNGEIRTSSGILFGTDTAAANALDDYEEGSWTPVIQGTGSNNSKTYGFRQGHYTKVGRLVTCSYRVTWSANAGDSGAAIISGLPFTINEGTASGGAFTANNLDFPSAVQLATTETADGQTFIYFLLGFDGSTWQNAGTSLYQSTGEIRGQFHYVTNS